MLSTKSSFAGFSLVAAFALTTQLSMEGLSSSTDMAPKNDGGNYNISEYSEMLGVSHDKEKDIGSIPSTPAMLLADCDLPWDHC
ncbi:MULTISPECIES: hypothetical protein [Pseudomonas]|uniref:Uncharacterized protein n=1 Tax=Pseudomonas mandelii TaxID=75612 RepID=A0AB36CVF0_9PSED|nr:MULTISPECIES: hypothetical protein [Pseudomonas]MBU0526725.1 hypothetical protein [Gammaproteobacteria bacterium]NMZ80036.1 hypothetical protein [Pseudomonas mandelii]